METVWKSYGHPMEALWTNTRATRPHRAIHAPAARNDALLRRPTRQIELGLSNVAM